MSLSSSVSIYLIRHSEPLSNFEGTFHEDAQIANEKCPLSSRGEEKAKQLSEDLEASKVSYVVSSPYVRAIATAKYFAQKYECPILLNPAFGERKLGQNYIPNLWGKQLLDPFLKPEGGESLQMVQQRMDEGLCRCLAKGSGIIVSHGFAMTALFMKYMTLSSFDEETKFRRFSHCGQVQFEGQMKTPHGFRMDFEKGRFISLTDLSRELL